MPHLKPFVLLSILLAGCGSPESSGTLKAHVAGEESDTSDQHNAFACDDILAAAVQFQRDTTTTPERPIYLHAKDINCLSRELVFRHHFTDDGTEVPNRYRSLGPLLFQSAVRGSFEKSPTTVPPGGLSIEKCGQLGVDLAELANISIVFSEEAGLTERQKCVVFGNSFLQMIQRYSPLREKIENDYIQIVVSAGDSVAYDRDEFVLSVPYRIRGNDDLVLNAVLTNQGYWYDPTNRAIWAYIGSSSTTRAQATAACSALDGFRLPTASEFNSKRSHFYNNRSSIFPGVTITNGYYLVEGDQTIYLYNGSVSQSDQGYGICVKSIIQ